MAARLWLSAVTLALGLSGCATTPAIPPIKLAPTDRVGYLVELQDEPTHTHIGTTVFNNFSKSYPYSWDLSTRIGNVIHKRLEAAGLAAVDLRVTGLTASVITGIVQVSGDTWVIASDKTALAKRLREEQKVGAVIVVRPANVLALLECSGGPCSERMVGSPGLFSRSIFGMTRYFSVPAFGWSIYSLTPPADLARADPLARQIRMQSAPVQGISPADFYALTERDLQPVLESILTTSGSIVESASQQLKVNQ